ncbi:hypothetical protein EMCG_06349 [[Emmonsia] crescens]|uniref:Uncharacterized protein n=1 Tax=[Emmonsia] crescens TaxID=73230 RepID=A0A0G2IBI2_9EURO|nr:hypothetical protein EMCG_06349 [Emmonsia crescens UAMH 3008]
MEHNMSTSNDFQRQPHSHANLALNSPSLTIVPRIVYPSQSRVSKVGGNISIVSLLNSFTQFWRLMISVHIKCTYTNTAHNGTRLRARSHHLRLKWADLDRIRPHGENEDPPSHGMDPDG